ncbi:MAG: RloB domain-containing protein [Saprospiraceae bacterium]|jgi:hypothetical protein|nr:RloB domain-containing protein [Saprospiraceae bacterium]
MARKQKVPNHLKKRLERKESRRKVGVRNQRQYFLIVCEGEKTEPLYFEALKADLPKGALENAVVDIQGEGKNTLSLIEETQKIRLRKELAFGREYDQVWAVFDRDSFLPEKFNNAIHKARDMQPSIHCAWSNEAFELWYLLHFEYYQDAGTRRDYQSRLEQAITKRIGKGFTYQKNDPGIYALLKAYGNLEQAIKWASALEAHHDGGNYAEHNPCTLVYRLVQELIKLK